MNELITKIAEFLKDHDKKHPFTAEGYNITGNELEITHSGNGDIEVQPWNSCDYYATFLGCSAKEWCKLLDLDITKIKIIIAETDCCTVSEVTDGEVQDYILGNYDTQVYDVIADAIEQNTDEYISSAESLLEMYEDWQKESRRGTE